MDEPELSLKWSDASKASNLATKARKEHPDLPLDQDDEVLQHLHTILNANLDRSYILSRQDYDLLESISQQHDLTTKLWKMARTRGVPRTPLRIAAKPMPAPPAGLAWSSGGTIKASSLLSICDPHHRFSNYRDLVEEVALEVKTRGPVPKDFDRDTLLNFEFGHFHEPHALETFLQFPHECTLELRAAGDGIFVADDWPHIGVSFDAVVHHDVYGVMPVEIKSHARSTKTKSMVPDYYIWQVRVQLMIAHKNYGSTHAYFVSYVPRVFDPRLVRQHEAEQWKRLDSEIPQRRNAPRGGDHLDFCIYERDPSAEEYILNRIDQFRSDVESRVRQLELEK